MPTLIKFIMIISILGNLIDLKKIYRIGPVKSNGYYSFIIYFLNKKELLIIKEINFVDIKQNEERTLSYEEMDKIRKDAQKIEKEKSLTAINSMHKALSILWNDNKDEELISLDWE